MERRVLVEWARGVGYWREEDEGEGEGEGGGAKDQTWRIQSISTVLRVEGW